MPNLSFYLRTVYLFVIILSLLFCELGSSNRMTWVHATGPGEKLSYSWHVNSNLQGNSLSEPASGLTCDDTSRHVAWQRGSVALPRQPLRQPHSILPGGSAEGRQS